MQKSGLLLLAVLSILQLTFSCGCGRSYDDGKAENITDNNKIIIENGSRKLEFNGNAKRLVTLRQHITETALAIDLDQYIVGASSVLDPPVWDKVKNRYNNLNIIAEKYPSIEVLLNTNPEVVWVDRKWAFVKNQLGSLENIEKQGIKVYFSKSAFTDRSKMEYVYEDIENMGRLFNKKREADIVLNDMKKRVNDIQRILKGTNKKVRVMDYDNSRNNMAFIGARCMADDLINHAGGVNIFADINKEWATVNWEEVVKRKPDVIVVHEYRGISGKSKINALKSKPILQDVPAVKNNRFIILNLDEIYEGARNAETIEKLAKGFYPDLFK